MQCPVDGETLQMADRAGVEIDYCPKCRGVWLDRGELDKIIERSASDVAPEPTRDPRGGHEGHHGKPYKKKKKESFLSEIFDF